LLGDVGGEEEHEEESESSSSKGPRKEGAMNEGPAKGECGADVRVVKVAGSAGERGAGEETFRMGDPLGELANPEAFLSGDLGLGRPLGNRGVRMTNLSMLD